jgi:hypothetical protein
MMEDLHKALTNLLNRYSSECTSDTPDYILAMYILDSLTAFERGVIRRDYWYGRTKIENEIEYKDKQEIEE